MRRTVFLSFCCAIFVLTPAIAATTPDSVAKQQTTKKVTRNLTATGHATQAAWPAETLTGTVMMVEANRDLVIVQGPDKVPFDLRVTPSTRIRSGNKPLKLEDLTSDQSKPVSVTFVPTGSGDVARTIHITG